MKKDKNTGSLCGGLKFEPFKPKKKKTLKPKVLDGSGYIHPSTLKMIEEDRKKKTIKKK